MKKFASKSGFTLVELIVVIAILGILASVAVPAYSGYIKKANEAKDTQLLSAVNTAFAAACAENGISNTDVTVASVTVDTNKKITGITVTTLATGVADVKAKVQTSFNTYFAGNGDTALGYYTSFSFANGRFTGVKS